MKRDTIGIFDSGVGGLSILKEFVEFGYDFIYFGDTKNVPYGDKTKDEIINLSKNIINFFIEKNVKKVVMACNTSSAFAYGTLKKEYENKVKIYPLIQTVAPYIAKENKKIGIMATYATVSSKCYTNEIKKYNPDIEVVETECSGLVEIVENRTYEKPASIKLVKSKLDFLLNKGCEKIVLGCTHYPYLMPVLTKFAKEDIFINPAHFMKNVLEKKEGKSSFEFYVTGSCEDFIKSAELFMNIKEVKNI